MQIEFIRRELLLSRNEDLRLEIIIIVIVIIIIVIIIIIQTKPQGRSLKNPAFSFSHCSSTPFIYKSSTSQEGKLVIGCKHHHVVIEFELLWTKCEHHRKH